MQRLAELKEKEIGRGAVFRVKAEYPYEEVVDFMLVETTDAERPLGVMAATGYSAGHTFVHLPREALMKGTRMLSAEWLKQNWGPAALSGTDVGSGRKVAQIADSGFNEIACNAALSPLWAKSGHRER